MAIHSVLFQVLLSISAGIVVAMLSGYISRINERQWWLTEEIYGPLFNEVQAVAHEGELVDERNFRSVWIDFDPYQKYRVGGTLRREIQVYIDLLERFNGLDARVKDYDAYFESLPEGVVGQHERGWRMNFDGAAKSPMWLENVGELVYKADDPSEFREQMNQKTTGINAPSTADLAYWDKTVQGWHKEVWASLQNEDFGLVDEAEEYSQLKYEQIPEQAEELKKLLKNRIEEGFLEHIRRRVSETVR